MIKARLWTRGKT